MHLDTTSYHLDKKQTDVLHVHLTTWGLGDKTSKLWTKDASVWTNDGESKWLGWLNIAAEQLANMMPLITLAAEVKRADFKAAVLLGMGGSSLGPEVLELVFGSARGFPDFYVLDSIDPAQIKTLENKLTIENTLFIVSSKSGSTLEPNILKEYFFDKARTKLGSKQAGDHFIAVTDPGSQLEQVAKKDGFKAIYYGLPSIGGRYSILSNFGLVPAAVLGLDLAGFLNRTHLMVEACGTGGSAENNPGILLGTILGVLAGAGRDKVTIIATPAIASLGSWLEQLLAESTGKIGKGLIPVDGEPLGSPDVYSDDRLFVYLRLHENADAAQDQAMDKLQDAGQPVIRIGINAAHDIGQEFFRWQIATATVGSIMGINPFDQPDVEASKVATRKLTIEYERTGQLPSDSPFFEDRDCKLFADQANAAAITNPLGHLATDKTLTAYLKAHIARIKPHDYFALLAYIERCEENTSILTEMRTYIRDYKNVATCLGFGPRFLHSTGQAYKGGPNSGVFLQITSDDEHDLPIPNCKYTFGIAKAAQAAGDLEVLNERKRRTLRIHLKGNTAKQLRNLNNIIKAITK